MRVLIVEDNVDLQENIAEFLEADMDLDFAYSGDQGLELAMDNDYDVIVLDLKLPGLDGLDLCSTYRAEARSQAAIIMLTARDSLDDKAAGFAAGADDYLVKPFSLRELRMRIDALGRRGRSSGSGVIEKGALQLNMTAHVATHSARSVSLHAKSATLLCELMRQAPAPVGNDRLSYALWRGEPPDSGALRTHIYHLREALATIGAKQMVKTVRGRGYAFDDQDMS